MHRGWAVVATCLVQLSVDTQDRHRRLAERFSQLGNAFSHASFQKP